MLLSTLCAALAVVSTPMALASSAEPGFGQVIDRRQANSPELLDLRNVHTSPAQSKIHSSLVSALHFSILAR